MKRDFPYLVLTNKIVIFGQKSWCRDQFGPEYDYTHKDATWTVMWGGTKYPGTTYEWHFRTEAAALAFKLRWETVEYDFT